MVEATVRDVGLNHDMCVRADHAPQGQERTTSPIKNDSYGTATFVVGRREPRGHDGRHNFILLRDGEFAATSGHVGKKLPRLRGKNARPKQEQRHVERIHTWRRVKTIGFSPCDRRRRVKKPNGFYDLP